VRDSATQASLLFTSSSPDLHPPASIQLCAHGGTSTVIPVSTDHSRAQQNAFQVFQSNQVCDSDEYAGRVVWDATDPDAVDATAALTASLFLSTAHQNSDANAASSTPILDISCHTPTSGVSGDAPLTTPPPRNFDLIPRGATPSNLVFIEFGAPDVALLEESAKEWHALKSHNPSSSSSSFSPAPPPAPPSSLPPSYPQYPTEMTMEQLETEINKLGRVGTQFEKTGNRSASSSGIRDAAGTMFSPTGTPLTAAQQQASAAGTTTREQANHAQCGELGQAFAQCVKRSPDLGMCANERGQYERCHRDVQNEYRFKSYVGNRMKAGNQQMAQTRATAKACAGVTPCHIHPMQGPIVGLSSTLGLPNPLPGWPIFGVDLSAAAGVILMAIIMGTVGRAINILAIKFGQTFAAKIPPIIMAALVFGLPKCPPLPAPVLWFIPGCGPKCPPVPAWLMKLLPGFWKKCAGPKAKLASPLATDMPALDDLKAKAKAALDAANAALAGNKAALDKAQRKAGLAIASAKEAAVGATSGPLMDKAAKLNEQAKEKLGEVGAAEDAISNAAQDSAAAAEDYAAAVKAREDNRKKLLDEITSVAANAAKHALPVLRPDAMTALQHREAADRWQAAAGSLCELLVSASRDTEKDVQLMQIAMARADVARVGTLATAGKSQIQYAGFHIDRAGQLDTDALDEKIHSLEVDERMDWAMGRATDRRNDFMRLHNTSVVLAGCAERAKEILLHCQSALQNALDGLDHRETAAQKERDEMAAEMLKKKKKGDALTHDPTMSKRDSPGETGRVYFEKEKAKTGRPDIINLEPAEWDAETPPSFFLSTREAEARKEQATGGDGGGGGGGSARPPADAAAATVISEENNLFYNASAEALSGLQKRLNTSLRSLDLLQEELHREDKVTLFEAKRTWLFARRLADLYGGGDFYPGGQSQADAYDKILNQIDRVIQNDKDQVESLRRTPLMEPKESENDPRTIAASTIAATAFIEEFHRHKLFSGSAMSLNMQLNLAKGKRPPPGKMAGSMVTMLVKQLAEADTVMYTRLITERAAPMIKRALATRFGTEVNGESNIQEYIADKLLDTFSSMIPRALASTVPHTLNAILPSMMMHKYKTVLPQVLTRSLVHALTPTLVHTLSSAEANQHRGLAKEQIMGVWSTFYESYYTDYFTNRTHYDPSTAAIKAREAAKKNK
jgi:hypothetical protein